MDDKTILLVFASVAGILGVIDLFMTRARSLLGWAVVALSLALILPRL